MKIQFSQFNPKKFSFHQDPVLVLENFWSEKETAQFRDAMSRSKWTALAEMPPVASAFKDCGNWLKAEIGPQEANLFLERLALPCIFDYVESFPNIKQRHVNFNFYSYGVGDCLSTHDDTDEAYAANRYPPPPLRRLALATYFHQEWKPDWGGELILYKNKKDADGNMTLEVSQCVAPNPGSVAIFAVPRFHRVCRVDQLAGEHKRLSIAGWFMTEHFS